MSYSGILLVYICLANITGWAQMGIDKRRAQKGGLRVPEKQLFLTAFLGGSLGSWLGMQHFRHKTQHWNFKIGIPVILLLQFGVLFYYFYSNY
jgi:uncharacterized membrane protein YsdA (DUF1294 family)